MFKTGKDITKHFSKEDVQMADKHQKKKILSITDHQGNAS